jgi:hypothetical protein
MPLAWDQAVTQGVDPVTQLVEPPGPKPSVNRALCQAEREKLPASHHSMLSLRQLRDRSISFASPRGASVCDG